MHFWSDNNEKNINSDPYLNVYKHNCCCISKPAKIIYQRGNFMRNHYSQYLQGYM